MEEMNFPLDERGDHLRSGTLREYNEQITTTLQFLISIPLPTAEGAHLIPPNFFNTVRSLATSEIPSQLPSLVSKLEALKQSGGISNFQRTNFLVTDTQGNTQNLQPHFVTVWIRIEEVIAFLGPVLLIPRIHSESLSQLATQLHNAAGSAKVSATDVAARLQEVQQAKASIDELKKAADASITAMQSTFGELQTSLRDVVTAASKDHGTIKSTVEQIETIGKSAATLKATIDEFSGNFDAFEKALANRMTTLDRANKDTDTNVAKNKEREKEIQRLTEAANSMLQGATVAGLSKSFADQAEAYGNEANTAAKWFYGALLTLFVSALPLVIYVLPLPDDLVKIKEMFGGPQTLTFGGILSRLVILIPAFWFAKFTSGRFARASYLQQQYKHKQSLAQSVAGFKKEAPHYQEEIAATVFLELGYNPLRQRWMKEDSDPTNPILKKLVKIVHARLQKYLDATEKQLES